MIETSSLLTDEILSDLASLLSLSLLLPCRCCRFSRVDWVTEDDTEDYNSMGLSGSSEAKPFENFI